jgi:methylmalonyl-CoA mutase
LRGASAASDEATPSRLELVAPWQVPTATALAALQDVARAGGNVFTELLRTVCVCSLGQITRALYTVGGQYRRSM